MPLTGGQKGSKKGWSLKDGIAAGVVAGVLWGWATLGVNALSGVFPFEGTVTHNIVTFSFAGAVFGVVVAGLFTAVRGFLPFKGVLQGAVFVSTALWLAVRALGMGLSAMEPERYHLVSPEFIQGVVLAVLLGGILGLVLKKGLRTA